MKTKLSTYSIRVCILLLLALLPLSCIKDDSVSKETATVTMTFSTRAINSSVSSADDLEENEHMRTLRVIVARENGEILYNVKYDIDKDETSKIIKFSEMTVNAEGETFDFYAIANENGVGYTEKSWDNVTIADLKSMNLQSGFLTNANDASKNTMIPQTSYRQIKVMPQSGGGIQTENMTLDFAVAKVRLTIHNTSAGDQYVNDIKLSGLNMASTPLFAGESLSTENQGKLSLGNMTVPAGKSATVYAYFFENMESNYILSASWNGTKTLDITHAVDPNITQISRGTALNINITLNATTKPEFNIEVVPWETVEVDVPPFN